MVAVSPVLYLGFKPLQNGAVLRSTPCEHASGRGRDVSNPFKTGRYCVVDGPGNQQLPGDRCFKPLQNGAVLRRV